MLLGTLAAILLGNMLRSIGVIRAGEKQIELVRVFNTASSFN